MSRESMATRLYVTGGWSFSLRIRFSISVMHKMWEVLVHVAKSVAQQLGAMEKGLNLHEAKMNK